MALPGGFSVLVFLGLGVLGLGVLLHIVAMATPAWTVVDVYNKYGSGSAEAGPFRACTKLGGRAENCVDVDSGGSSDLEAVRAMTVIGALLSMAALLVGIIMIVMGIMEKGVHKLFPLIIGGASVGAFVFILLGVIIWGASVHGDGGDLGYSFGLSIGGGILIAIGGVLVFVAAKKTSGTN